MAEQKRLQPTSRTLPLWRRIRLTYLASFLAALAVAALIVELMANWPLQISAPDPLQAVGILLLSALLAAVLDWGLSPTQLSPGWIHRGSVALASLAILAIWLILALDRARTAPFGWVLAGACGALLGGMAASWRREGFHENNQPPSAQIRQEVAARHYELIGNPEPGSLPKRVFDLVLAGLGLLVSSPALVLISLLIWLEDPGPLVFIKNSVGKGGVNFHQFKFRTMVSGAETDTGPIPARESDSRVLKTGRFLRKTALDELPQLFNILKGEMSFVGPRPQRTVLVYVYLRDLPGFTERHAVLPGLAGLAQVAGHYFLTPRQKLRYDRLYARHASLGFDLKLLAIACALVFWLRWRPGWDGRIPRAWLHR
ncbi:MAG TPA: sugar transferase [Anaerolineales bacterium]|nr:sugar transferase [Anaerolineales bacterium]